MRTLYHEFESLEHLLSRRLLPGGEDEPIRLVVFGGTGAVGGAVILELCRLSLRSKRFRPQQLRVEVHATGSTAEEIDLFAQRLHQAMARLTTVEEVEAQRHYRVDGCIDLHFSLLRLALPEDLPQHLQAARREQRARFDLEKTLGKYFLTQPQPFLDFVRGLEDHLLHAVVVAIPLPSVATYTLGVIDRLIAAENVDHRVPQRIKAGYLHCFVSGLAEIQQQHARYVVIAHTTAVGGMYRVDGVAPEIRLGFAHSALGKKLVDKKYFADDLTQLYLDNGFDALVTAAAIGIDAVDFGCQLPLGRPVQRSLAAIANGDLAVLPASDLESGKIHLYPTELLPIEGAEDRRLSFGAGRELRVDAAVRSGENGMFSVANCVALYNVMKVAIPEELAMVLVRHAVFGPERRRDWFQDKISFYEETENAAFALRLLANTPELERAHLGTFCPQAYQALGSSTHQARLHELGLLRLLLRLQDLARNFADFDDGQLNAAATDLESFFWQHTALPCFEDLEDFDPSRLAQLFGQLCEIDSPAAAGRFLGLQIQADDARPGRDQFLEQLTHAIRDYLQTITSLGTPILYRQPDSAADRLLVGPYLAPLDLAIGNSGDLHRTLAQMAEPLDLDLAVVRDWVVSNNGFLDLRPLALVSCATEPSPELADSVHQFSHAAELADWIDSLQAGSYFTTSGTVALLYRLGRLTDQLRGRQIELGTLETWKHLFRRTAEGKHVLEPGLVETTRMYCEGLGKVTGTEALWPEWGY